MTIQRLRYEKEDQELTKQELTKDEVIGLMAIQRLRYEKEDQELTKDEVIGLIGMFEYEQRIHELEFEKKRNNDLDGMKFHDGIGFMYDDGKGEN